MSTFKSGADYVKALEKRLKKVDDAIYLEYQSTQDQFITRVFDEGKNAQGVRHGTYSPGYKRQRIKAGKLQNSYVNLQFDGDMRKDLATAPKKKGKKIQTAFFGGRRGEPKKVKNPRKKKKDTPPPTNEEKWEYMEKLYGTLGELSTTEKKELYERIDKSVTKILAGA